MRELGDARKAHRRVLRQIAGNTWVPRSHSPPAIDLNANVLKLDKQAAGRGVAFLLALATPPQIRQLAAHFAENQPEIGEECGQLI